MDDLSCTGGPEAHEAHMSVNGDCPWDHVQPVSPQDRYMGWTASGLCGFCGQRRRKEGSASSCEECLAGHAAKQAERNAR